ncbi:UNVERIFIED_CONTAM: hypothetical protein K2H54_031191, partial [Gekko kuhli]
MICPVLCLFSETQWNVGLFLCAKNLVKKDFFRLPDPFAKVVVDGSGQCHSTDTVKNTLDPKWNQHYDLRVEFKEVHWVRELRRDMKMADGGKGVSSEGLSVVPLQQQVE